MATTITLTIGQLAADMQQQVETVRRTFNSIATRKKIAILAVAGVKDHFANGTTPEGIPWAPLTMRAGKPLRDTGRLMQANVANVTADGVQLANNNVQAGLMQRGGKVVAKNGKYLAIPLTTEAKRSGGPRRMSGLRFIKKKGADKGVMVDQAGTAQFALVPSVTIPARPFLGFSARTLDRIEKTILDDVVKALGG